MTGDRVLMFPDPGTVSPSSVARYGRPLSPREMEVVRLKSDGAPSKEVAGDLGITEQTVKNHITSIIVKTGAPNLLAVCVRLARSQHGPECPTPGDGPLDADLEGRVTALERAVGLR